MALQPPRRSFSEVKKKSGLKDVDSADRARKLHAWGWSIYGGVPIGVGLGLLMDNLLLGILLGPFVVFFIVAGIAAISGRGATVIYMPSGSGTPRRREYSRAKALEVRGDFEGAIRAYHAELLEAPMLAEPYLKIARLHRDELKDLDGAISWFKRAQAEARLLPGEAMRTHRELAEIFLHLRKEPRRAAPELARLAEGFPTTRDGKWAAEELAAIKDGIARDLSDPAGES